MTRADLLRLVEVRRLAGSGQARRRRVRARLSIAEVAKSVGVSTVCVYRWETGQRSPRGEPALRYADVLDSIRGSR